MGKGSKSQGKGLFRGPLADLGDSFPELRAHLNQLQRFRVLLDHANDIILLVQLTSQRIVDANVSACRLLKYDDEDLIGVPVEKVIDFERLQWPENSGEGAGCRTIVTRLHCRDGGWIPVEMLFCMDEFDGSAYVVIVARDIAERLRVEEALRQSEERFRSIVDSTPLGVHLYRLDEGGRLVFIGANPAADGILGVDHGQFAGLPLEEAFPALVETEIPERYLRTCTLGEAWTSDQVVYEDSRICGAYQVHAFRTGPGMMASIFMDITERKRAEENLAQSRKQFRNLVETINDWVWETDRNGVYTYSSPRVRDLLGYEPEEVIGKTPFDLMPESEGERVAGLFAEAVKRQDAFFSLENTNRHKDGHLVVLETSGVPFFDEGKNWLGYRGVDRDISVRKKAEEALRESDRMKSEFISTAAHELRTPLTSILGFSQILLEQENLPAAEQKEFLTYIHQKAKALSEIVSDLLDISRIESGQGLALNRVACTAGELVTEVLPFIQVGPSVSRYELAVAAEASPLLVDKGKMVQVFENLLSNAVKYSPPASPIRISGKVEGEHYLFSVADQGVGMTSDQASRVFDKFYRADASDTAVGGLGLGMGIVRNIVEAHGGRIGVRSQPGRGTTICFSIPLRRDPEEGGFEEYSDR